MKHAGRINKKLTMAILLALTLGTSLPVYAETVQTDVIEGQQLSKGEWNLEKPVFVTESNIEADQVSLKDRTFPASTAWKDEYPVNYTNDAPIVLGQDAVLNVKKGMIIDNLKLGVGEETRTDISGLFASGGSTIETPTLEISHIGTTDDNEVAELYGLDTYTYQEDSGRIFTPHLKVDTIHIHDVSSDREKAIVGAGLSAVDWTALTKGTGNNLLIENIHNENTAEGSLAFGLLGGMLESPLTISGRTELKNITSNGSALGIFTQISETLKSALRFHQLDISGIQGKDLSIGLFGGTGTVSAENADINMTGKKYEYDGLYQASIDDGKKASVTQFAIAGPYAGSMYLNESDGKYTIHGNILADQGNHGKVIEAQYKFSYPRLKEQLAQEDLSESERQSIQTQLDYLDKLKEQINDMGQINLGGHLKLYGDVYAKNGGTLNLHLQEGSYFEGQADDYADYDAAGQLTPRKVDINADLNQSSLGQSYYWQDQADMYYEVYGIPYLDAGSINLTMDPGSKWQTRGKSFITSLNFNHGGLVDTRKGHGVSVTIGKLTGEGGTFLMDFSKDAAKSDMIYVKDLSQSGVQHIQAYLLPDTKVEELKGIRFATTGGDDYKRDPAAKFDVSLVHNQGVNNITLKVKNEKFNPDNTAVNEKFNGGKNGVGTYKPGNDYVTAVFSGKGFTKEAPDQDKIFQASQEGKQTTDDAGNLLPEYLKTVTIENPVKEGTNWFIDTAVLTPSDSGKIIKKSSQLDYTDAVYGIYTDTLNKRLGEARYSADGDGMWARVRHDRLGREALYDARNTMTELGYDWTRAETASGRHIQGAAFDLMNGSADYKELDGNSDVKRYGAWFYDTRLGNDGHYTDLVAKYGRLFNKFNLLQDNGMPVQGDYHNDYYSLSLEYGRKLPLSSSWYIEPQAQAQYTYLGSTDYHTTQGSRVHLAGTDSFISRLGFRIGQDIGKQSTFYINADFLHEFLGNQDIFAQDMTGSMNVTGHNDGSWYDVGLGLTTHLNKDTYAFLNCDKSFGPKIEHTWSMEAGINWQF